MKKITLSFIALLFALGQFDALAQAPQSFKYQSVARGSNGLPIASANIGLRISVHDGSATGTVVYKETHTAATNAFGVFSISVGGGTIVNGIFSSIDWGSGSKFIEVEADFNGGTSYTSMGASQLLSVPYALYSQNGTPGPKGDKGDKGDAGVAGLKGDKGDSGIAGPQGLPGPIGADGATGAQGLKGDKGDTGDAGPQGIQGLKGDKGDAGDPGVAFDNTQVLTDKTWTSSKINSELGLKVNTSALSTVATSGDYIDLTNKPMLATVATSGSYNDLTNKPVTDGSETKVTAGSNITVTGSGTTTSPYVVNAAGGSGWSLTGNSGTVDGTNFIGTTDDVPLIFKVGNQKAGRIETDAFSGNNRGNSFFGYQAGYSNTTGNFNTANGRTALFSNTTGSSNTANGVHSLSANTTGYENTANGMNALSTNTTGFRNTANGLNALRSNTTGFDNTANGYNALYSNMGSGNTANGVNALTSNSTGIFNTAIGRDALYSNTTGNLNTALGNGADVSSGTLTNATAIGGGAIVNASNTIQLGNNAVTEVRMGTGNTATVITGGLQVTGGTPAAGKVLTSDATGLATWTTPASLPSGTTAGQMLYWNGSAWVTIPAGVNGQNLSFCNGVPTWGGCFQLTVNKTGAGSGTITSNIVGINCPGDCTEYYGGGTVVILTQTPAPGSSFGGWTGGGCSGTGICTITMNSAINVTAPFN